MIVGIFATIGLTGCFKGEVSVDVKQNGSGIISIAIGMTQQAKALTVSQGTDPFQEINQSLANGSDTAKDVKVTTWIDGDYEWAKAEKEFANLDEINKVLNGKKLFNKFSLTRGHGLIRDVFVLDAELAPLNSETTENSSGVDPAAFVQMSFSAHLPGKIIETNGLTDINDPNRIVWSTASKQSVSIKASSAAWNWKVIFVISGVLLVFGVVGFGGVGYFVYARLQKKKKISKPQPLQSVTNLPLPAIDFAGLGIEKLFLQLNEKVLDTAGQLQKAPGRIALVWKNQHSQEMMIEVRSLMDNQISINGNTFSANKKEIQEGIISEFKKEVKK